MKSNPKVSIITPSYNQGEFIEETILSVLNQTYTNIEYILFDACSSDQTVEVLKKYQSRISKLTIEKDEGQSDAINKGFKLATGDIVGWINSDDILLPNCVEEIVDVFCRNNDAALVYASDINIIDRNSIIYEKRTFNIEKVEDVLFHNSSVIQPGSFYNSERIKDVGFLDEKLKYCMDLDLWLKLLKIGKVYKIDSKPLASFRYYNETKSYMGGFNYSKERRKVLRNHGASIFSPSMLRSYISDIRNALKF